MRLLWSVDDGSAAVNDNGAGDNGDNNTITGDLFDCVDMYKQPAFDHPLLKNHTLQLKPSSLPKGMKLAKSKPASFYGFNDTCPSGTVLIHRTQKQHLIESKLLRTQFREHVVDDDQIVERSHFAIIETPPAQFYGVYAKIATYKLPDLQASQTSSSSIFLYDDAKSPTNMIIAGWQASPVIYETSYPRFYIYWTDSITGNWWITYNDELPLGYFPKELLPKMNDYVNLVQMGGEVKSLSNVPSPPMGSGHPSNEGPNKAAYFIEIQFLDQSNNWFVLNPESILTSVDIGDYYDISDNQYVDDKYVFAYGGVGGFK
ncbi:uncharacterized protein LOC121979997 [Zingiber officinale]|uniref:uncharacterized protein LOC121979997 n=1 Tax=Zingiber officinale TaxID=94328 RepID=UPI001C4B9282|nr:uncharacterized protein LOC121979997 [Zingiber officinale]